MSELASSESKLIGPILSSPDEGYVFDQMEGAIDTALFLAPLDIPIAIIGSRGTGKGFIARLIHDARDGEGNQFAILDCREFKGRASSIRTISNAFQSKVLKTLVFKSPHLLHFKVQETLARCIATRTLALKKPTAYLSSFKIVALFPAPIERLVRENLLAKNLASCFSAYPIVVPPLHERGHAVLRWADKILLQESMKHGTSVKGFSPDAQQAMLNHSWTGNISELRHRVVNAIKSTSMDWLVPVDLGLQIISVDQKKPNGKEASIFDEVDSILSKNAEFALSAKQELEVAIRDWCRNLHAVEPIPLGTWLHDELVLAAIDRYRGSQPKAASWLQVPSRNVRRWVLAINRRERERQAAKNASDHTRLIREWVREMPRVGPAPAKVLENMLLIETTRVKNKFDLTYRAGLFGVSVPTYRKKIKELNQESS